MAVKVFEIGDVLPATTQLKIIYNNPTSEYFAQEVVKTDNGDFMLIWFETGENFIINNSNYDYEEPFEIIIDTSSWTLSKRTVTYTADNEYPGLPKVFSWLDLNATAEYTNMGDFYLDVANSIRNKKGTTSSIKPVDFAGEISTILTVVELTQSQYDALATKDANTYYLIVEA